MKVNKVLIRQEAQKLLEDCNINTSPVDLDEIADYLKIKLIYEKLEDDISGFIKAVNNAAVCVINAMQHKNRQRFTLGHEIGHFVLHCTDEDQMFVDKGYHFRNSHSSSGEIRKEVEANQFAAELIMPRKQIVNAFEQIGDVFDSNSDIHIYELSRQFIVSERAMMFRLQNLGLTESYL